jgi:NAD/NADP transhydrogenase alpha subunit
VVTSDLINSLYVFILAAFIGFEVIRRVSPLLHTPLMSLTNALDAIAVVGAIILAGERKSNLEPCGHTGHDRHRRGHQQYRRRLHHHRSHA